MRLHLILLALAAFVAASVPTRADFVIGARIGDSFIVGGSGGVQARVVLGNDHYRERRRPRGSRLGRPGQLHSRIGLDRQRREQYPDHHRKRIFLVPVRERTRFEPEPRPVEPQPKPQKPAKPAIVVDKTPPDPSGHSRIIRARGAASRPEIAIGTVLPSNLPHVTLDPVRYDLPPVPPGQIYARVRGQVLLIDAVTRLVHDRIVPGT